MHLLHHKATARPSATTLEDEVGRERRRHRDEIERLRRIHLGRQLERGEARSVVTSTMCVGG